MKKLLFIRCFGMVLLLLAYSRQSYAQQNDYVGFLNDTMNVKMLIINRGFNTTLQQVDEEARLKFAPNNLNYLGVGWYFWGIGVKLNFPLPLSWFYDRASRNKSQVLDLRGTLFRKKWFLDGGLQWYQNLYLTDVQDPDQLPDEAQESGIEARRLQLAFTYLFGGEQLSAKAPFNRNHIQLQSAGTWMLTGGLSAIGLLGETSIVPSRLRSGFDSDSTVTELSAYAFQLRPGYAYNFVHRNFFMFGSGSLGLALQYKRLERSEILSTAWGVAPVYNFKAATGFDNGKYFAGVSAVFTFGYVQMNALRLQERSRNLELFVGYRFPEPNWLRDLKPGFLDW